MSVQSPPEIWARIEDILRLLPAARDQMKCGKTGPLRDADTAHYVELVDELADLMIALQKAEVTREIAATLAVIYGGAD